MDVGHGEKFILTSRDPAITGPILTLGTVAVTTAVIGNGTIAAARTLIAMTAERSSAAVCDRLEDFTVCPVNPAAVVLDEAVSLCTNDVGHLQGWPGHFFFNLRGRLTRSRLETSSASRGFGTA